MCLFILHATGKTLRFQSVASQLFWLSRRIQRLISPLGINRYGGNASKSQSGNCPKTLIIDSENDIECSQYGDI